VDRRGFLRTLLFLLGSTALASFVYPLVRFLAPPGKEAKGSKVTLKKSDLPSGSAQDIVIDNTPAVVLNLPDKGFVAISKVCTHLGCLVEYDASKKRLLCPCHAGIYSLDGSVVSGPPPKPLQKYPVKVQGEEIVIG